MQPLKNMKKKKTSFIIFLFSFCSIFSCSSCLSYSKWTVMIYIQARNNLAPYASQNLRDMAKAYGNRGVNIVAQWDQPKKKGAWRYKIGKESITLENYAEIGNPKDPGKKLVDFVKWGIENNPAQHYCLVLWNHGTGILNPPFGCPIRVLLNNRELVLNPRINIAGILEPELSALYNKRRGILFDEDNKVFIDNVDLQNSLKKITSGSILGRKLDCVGFDACFMGMVEIAYQIRKFAKYMIASEELELARGWDYLSLTSALTSQLPSPKEMAKLVVKTYGDYYKGRTNYYTQSAIDLQKIDQLKQSLDDMILKIGKCIKHGTNNKSFVKAVHRARNGCIQFSTRVYVDLYSFCKRLIERLTLEDRVPKGYEQVADLSRRPINRSARKPNLRKKKKPESKHIRDLIKSAKNNMELLDQIIVSRVASDKFREAKGLSIYFPYQNVDNAYRQSDFAKDSMWTHFLESLFRL
ncbi:clostripain-related cysteine peptidase [Candidatus Dependentiae bacterium]